ncbi:hypothetical protein HMPREF9136_0826 [Prevotella dentalis DSM 3688]|uniref:Uncharacterized protein n=1 Tax=Prevotella dentalis (strain ATCC 49559 / DSM 3688 / JCM 13448 / NCTC 12043 / ES 2772) TaxID=908937 RepID=F9D1U8_PREDD|nr:hypothetical protein HMPREF9136_0826 [Prevotella dentalis DSM 3688]
MSCGRFLRLHRTFLQIVHCLFMLFITCSIGLNTSLLVNLIARKPCVSNASVRRQPCSVGPVR